MTLSTWLSPRKILPFSSAMISKFEKVWSKKLGSISSISGFKPSSLRAILRRLVVKSFIFRTSSKLDAIFSLDSIMVASGFLKSVSRRFCRTAKGVRNSWEAFSTKAFCFCILSRRGLTLRRAKKRLANKEIPQKQIMTRAIWLSCSSLVCSSWLILVMTTAYLMSLSLSSSDKLNSAI